MKRKRHKFGRRPWTTWFTDWRDWYGPRTYGLGLEPKTLKGVFALFIVISALAISLVVLNSL